MSTTERPARGRFHIRKGGGPLLHDGEREAAYGGHGDCFMLTNLYCYGLLVLHYKMILKKKTSYLRIPYAGLSYTLELSWAGLAILSHVTSLLPLLLQCIFCCFPMPCADVTCNSGSDGLCELSGVFTAESIGTAPT